MYFASMVLLDLFWLLTAKLLSAPFVANWLIKRAMKTPYSPIVKDGEVYMDRFWLFNPYFSTDGQQEASKYKWWPWNVRIHHIRLADVDRHMHDHPWNARTIILRGHYIETRLLDDGTAKMFLRVKGDTARIGFGEYHSILNVSHNGVWTLFISGPYQGVWGFWVDGAKVLWRQYLGLEPK